MYVIWFKPLILPWPASPSWYLPQICGLSLPLLLLIHSKNDLLTQISSKSISCRAQLACSKTTRKTTFQSRLRIAAQETEPTRERDEFKSKFPAQALSYATCPSDNTYFKVIQNFSKYFGAFRSNSRQFWNQTAARAAGKCLVSSAFLLLLETWLLGSFLFALFHSLKPLSCSSCAAPPFELCSGGVDEVTVASNSLILSLGESGWL